jgi:ribosomal protein S18 acetylase RimI-like enzyme
VPPTDPSVPEVRIRPLGDGEAVAVADLYLRVRLANLGAIPPVAHPEESVRDWFSTVLPVRDELWVAEVDGVIVGFVAIQPPDWVDQIYVDGAYAGLGIGTALIDVASRELGGAVQLWTFQSNVGARRFYERLGFEAVELTDGDNEEGAPDVRYLREPS